MILYLAKIATFHESANHSSLKFGKKLQIAIFIQNIITICNKKQQKNYSA